MNTMKTIIITLALMTTASFADFTIKDLFVSGGTQSTKDVKEDKQDNKNTEQTIKVHDCQ